MGWRWASKEGFLHNELDDVRLEKTMETMKNSQKNRYFRPFLKEILGEGGARVTGASKEGDGGGGGEDATIAGQPNKER